MTEQIPIISFSEPSTNIDANTSKSWRSALLPKHETKAYDFLIENPTYDGRGAVIGILDTGVDPSAAGLQSTSTGLPKVIGLVDCSGSGDVDVSTVVELDVDDEGNLVREVTGLTGRKLVLNPDWNIVDRKVQLGIKAAYDLYPAKLRERVARRRLKLFNEEQRRHAAIVRAELESIEDTPENSKNRENLEELLKLLEEHKSPFEKDVGPVFDCVVFFDGEDWRASIDTEETGDLSAVEALCDFRKKRQFAILGTADVRFTYAVNIYEDEEVLSVVSDAGAHGTHVAGIASAFYPDDSLINGVAPGAQIVGLKVGDSRLGSMETGTAFSRCLIESVRCGCDIINLSYGEAVSICNTGRHASLVKEIVRKHNIIFVASAGNNGPSLSTVGAPGASMDDIISVGAFFSRDMMISSYSLLLDEEDKDDSGYNAHKHGATYTWSSVGPTLDGATGVDIMAPGAAITCVPTWTLQKSQLMNGTSMSSPNLAGCVALLVSACKQNGISYTALSIREAIQKTATFIDGISSLHQGYGMINVQRAWDYMKSKSWNASSNLKFEVQVDGENRGIYVRSDAVKRTRHTIKINPTWQEDDSSMHDDRIKAEWQLSLKCSHKWIECPRNLVLVHNGRTFNVTVDPTSLESGVHTGFIEAWDDLTLELVVRVPVTLIVPHVSNIVDFNFGDHQFEPAEIKHFFLAPPGGCTFMDVCIGSNNRDNPSSTQTLVLHTVQLLPHSPYRAYQTKKYINLRENRPNYIVSIPIESNSVLELCLARYWSSVGDFRLSLNVSFRGLVPDISSSLCIASTRPVHKIVVNSVVKDEMLQACAKLELWKTGLLPKEIGTVTLLGKRDLFVTNRQIHQMILTYEYANLEKGKIIPRIPALQGFLYESALESQLIMAFDENKKLLGVADAWPGEIEVLRGTITFRVQIRHEDVEILKKFKDLEMFIERKLKESITLQAFDSHENFIQGQVSEKCLLSRGSSKAIFIGSPPHAKLPKGVKVGDLFEGCITLCQSSSLLIGGEHRPGGFTFMFVAGDSPKTNDKKANGSSDNEKWSNKFEVDQINLKCSFLEKLSSIDKPDQDFISAYEEFVSDHPSNISLRLVLLRHMDSRIDKSIEYLVRLYDICYSILRDIDEDKIAKHFGMFHDKDDQKTAEVCKEMEKLKDQYSEILIIKMKTIYKLLKLDYKEKLIETFDDALRHTLQWVDDTLLEPKYFELKLLREEKRPGVMLRSLYNIISDNKEKCTVKKKAWRQHIVDLYKELQFDHLMKLESSQMIVDYPKKYSLF